jgi:hypothetical protein
MVDFVPVEHDPFNDPPVASVPGPVPGNPSATGTSRTARAAGDRLVPVDHDPFAQ